jgi:hypothetical protein
MIAYVFWHWKQAGASVEDYERLQRGFQAALGSDPPEHFRGGRTYAIEGAPWAAGGRPAYEDWYLLDGMSDLERLNEAAVTGSRRDPHERIARMAGGGVAGVYQLKAGTANPGVRHAFWFAKPTGMSNPLLFEALAPVVTAAEGGLWHRQMVLGPASEFCLQGRNDVTMPARFAGTSLALRPVWPSRDAGPL